jgi:hypothetical protein
MRIFPGSPAVVVSGSAIGHHAGASKAQIYRPRRPAATLLHRVVRANLDSYLVSGAREDGLVLNIPFHVQTAFREYLKCGIPAHGFARVYCVGCDHDFLVPFSCKGGDVCPSCATRRMVETAAHMVDQVLPRVSFRQWVLSVPKRVRWHIARSRKW